MLKQSLYRKLLTTTAFLLCGWSCSQPHPPARALEFADYTQSLGERWAGEQILVSFTFTNNSGQLRTISQIETSCGCLNPRVFVDGERRSFPVEVASEESGIIEIDFNTAGFKGLKNTGATLFFERDAEPIELLVNVVLESWFRQNPQRIEFPESDGSSEQRLTVEFTGQQPFRFTEAWSVSPPLQIAGVPSGKSNITQSIELILPPQSKQGRSIASFNLLSDHKNFRVVGLASYDTKPPIWLIPNGKLLLGEVPSNVASFAAVDVGANVGTLEVLSAKIDGIDATEVRIQELEPGKRFRLHISITPDVPTGAFDGELILDLIHYFDGKKVPVTRKIPIFGVTTTSH
jgi:hypothetical protein